jgi:hypothetical protein
VAPPHPLQSPRNRPVNAAFTLIRDLKPESLGFGMSKRLFLRAMTGTAGEAGSAAARILGGLLLIRP